MVRNHGALIHRDLEKTGAKPHEAHMEKGNVHTWDRRTPCIGAGWEDQVADLLERTSELWLAAASMRQKCTLPPLSLGTEYIRSVTRTQTEVTTTSLLNTADATSVRRPGLDPKLQRDAEKLERVQQRVTTMVRVLKRMNCKKQLCHLGLCSLVKRQPTGGEQLLKVGSQPHHVKQCNKGQQPQIANQEVEVGYQGHFHEGIEQWNRLAREVVESLLIKSFSWFN